MRGSAIPVTVLLALAIAACGGGDGGGQAAATVSPPPAAPPPPSTDSPERLAAIAAVDSLLRAPNEYLSLASAIVDWGSYFQASTSQCPLAGVRQILLDGIPWYTHLPTGRHSLVAEFDSCTFAGPMQDLVLDGRGEVVYEMPTRENVSGTVTLRQFRLGGIYGTTFEPGPLADGSAYYVIEQSAQGGKRLVDLQPGATLTNGTTTNRIDFLGGRYAYTSDKSAGPTTDTEEYVGVTLDFNGVRYLLDGRFVVRNSGSPNCAGEIRITDGNGGLAARKYCAAGLAEYELIKPIALF